VPAGFLAAWIGGLNGLPSKMPVARYSNLPTHSCGDSRSPTSPIGPIPSAFPIKLLHYVAMEHRTKPP